MTWSPLDLGIVVSWRRGERARGKMKVRGSNAVSLSLVMLVRFPNSRSVAATPAGMSLISAAFHHSWPTRHVKGRGGEEAQLNKRQVIVSGCSRTCLVMHVMARHQKAGSRTNFALKERNDQQTRRDGLLFACFRRHSASLRLDTICGVKNRVRHVYYVIIPSTRIKSQASPQLLLQTPTPTHLQRPQQPPPQPCSPRRSSSPSPSSAPSLPLAPSSAVRTFRTRTTSTRRPRPRSVRSSALSSAA
jgi:hypothetical protein